MKRIMAGMLVIGAALAGGARAETWSGGGSEAYWTTGDNWGGAAPANPTENTITYDNTGTAVTGVVDAVGGAWQIGPLTVANTAGSHIVDLATNRLIVAGNLRAGIVADTSSIVFTNGILQIGVSGATREIQLGADGRGELKIAPGATLDSAYLSNIRMGVADSTGRGVLDLRGATIAGGTLAMDNLTMISSGGGGFGARFGEIRLDNDTEIDTFHVRGTALLADAGVPATARIGNPDDDWKLPAGLNLKFGVSEAGRGSLVIGRTWAYTATCAITASAGGSMTAWLTTLAVGHDTSGFGGAVGSATGTLDIRAMTNCLIDVAADVVIGKSMLVNNWGKGRVYLPPGEMKAGTLWVGDTVAPSSLGLLELYGTTVSVADWVKVYGNDGDINTYVGAMPCGLDLADAATLTVANGGHIQINFTNAPGGAGTHWGLRWKGDKRAPLAELLANGRLSLDHSAVSGKESGIVYDNGADYTYVALVDEGTQPPLPAARSQTIERDDAGSVWIGVADIDADSYDPNPENSIVGRSISTPGYQDGDQVQAIEFTTNGVYTVTLTITNNLDVTAAADCTVSIVPIPAGVQGALTWVGGATTALMERREWKWGANWSGGFPPANPTAGIITYDNGATSVTGIVDAVGGEWRIGGLSVANTAGSHTVDLATNRLTVAGNITAGINLETCSIIFTNGILQVGVSGATCEIQLGHTGRGDLTITPGATLDAAYLSKIRMADNDGGTGRGVLDLRGARLADGILGMDNLTMVRGGSGHYDRFGEIRLDDDTEIDTLHVRAATLLADGATQARAHIGNPADWKLPAGLSLKFGVSAASRGSLVIGRTGAYASSCAITATAGGDLTAWLTTLTVGENNSGWANHTATGTLDIRTMTNCMIDVATDVIIGKGTLTDNRGVGRVYLPSGELKTGTLWVGDTAVANSLGLLELYGTTATVADWVQVYGNNGDININVGAASCGLDLAEAATLTADNGGHIQLNFTTAPADGSQGHWGLRWAGADKEDELQALKDAGALDWDDDAVGGKVQIYTLKGYTYVGVPPPRGTLIMLR